MLCYLYTFLNGWRFCSLYGLAYSNSTNKPYDGAYFIDRRNPESLFHLSIGISYPNEADRAFAAAQGKSPGGDIFIHGGPRRGIDPMNKQDWTAGCIAVSNRQIEEIYAMVRDGTPIDIFA